MESEGSLLSSQEPTIIPCPKPHKSSPYSDWEQQHVHGITGGLREKQIRGTTHTHYLKFTGSLAVFMCLHVPYLLGEVKLHRLLVLDSPLIISKYSRYNIVKSEFSTCNLEPKYYSIQCSSWELPHQSNLYL
jgi:hypothetical protein